MHVMYLYRYAYAGTYLFLYMSIRRHMNVHTRVTMYWAAPRVTQWHDKARKLIDEDLPEFLCVDICELVLSTSLETRVGFFL